MQSRHGQEMTRRLRIDVSRFRYPDMYHLEISIFLISLLLPCPLSFVYSRRAAPTFLMLWSSQGGNIISILLQVGSESEVLELEKVSGTTEHGVLGNIRR